MLPRRHRLTRTREFTAVVRSGRRRAAGPALVVHRRDTPEALPVRVGFVVSKAVGNSVVRHRVSRRLRALMAERIGSLPAGTHLVVRANPLAARLSSRVLGEHLDGVLGRTSR